MLLNRKIKMRLISNYSTKIMNRINSVALSLILVYFLSSCSSISDKVDSSNYEGLEFEMAVISDPVIPANSVSIIDFGSVNGGIIDNTKAFADAIEAVSARGGGKVIIPAGIWLTGPIMLKSNLELHAQQGALIRFSTNKDLYPIIETSFEGLNTWRCISPIYGKNLENVAFTGSGVWDGSGEAWRAVKKSKLTESVWKELVASGGIVDNNTWYPSEQYKIGSNGADQNVRLELNTKEDFLPIRDFLRPVMVSIQNSKNIMLDGPVFQNSPAWCLHPLMVENLIVRNIKVRNPWYSQNGDGIDVESCKNVIVENSSFDVGDDAICIKSGKDKDGRERGVPCENVVIRNNVVYHGHGGVTVGSEMSGGVRNMHVSNCIFMGTDVGLRFKSTRGRGGVVENIFMSNIHMTDIPTYAISFNLFYGGKSITEMLEEGDSQETSPVYEVNEETPQFKNIIMKDITIDGAKQAVFLQGLPEMNLQQIEIKNLKASSDNGFSIIDADGVKLSNIQLTIKNEQIFDVLNVKNLLLSETEFNSKSADAIRINGSESAAIVLDPKLSEQTVIGRELNPEAVKFE
jgi:polygalacturonase